MKTIVKFLSVPGILLILSGCMPGRPGMPVMWNGFYYQLILGGIFLIFIIVLIKIIGTNNKDVNYGPMHKELQNLTSKLDELKNDINEIKELLKNKR